MGTRKHNPRVRVDIDTGPEFNPLGGSGKGSLGGAAGVEVTGWF